MATNMRQQNSKMKQFKTKTFQTDPKWVGLIIGKAGATIKRLAKESGDTCRIFHDRSNPGKFDISAKTSQELLRAEINIQKLIQSKQEQPIKNTQRNRNQTTVGLSRHQPIYQHTSNAFSILQTENTELDSSFTPAKEMDGCQLLKKKPEEDLFQGISNKKTPSKKSKKDSSVLTLNFKDEGSIRNRKHQKWLEHHASEEEKTKYQSKNKKESSSPPRPTIIFPNLSYLPNKVVDTGIWGIDKMEKVKAAKQPTPPTTPNKFGNLQQIIPGEKKEEEEFRVVIPKAPRKKLARVKGIYEDENTLEDDFDPEYDSIKYGGNTEDEEDWSEGEYEYGRFEDEEDHTLLECA